MLWLQKTIENVEHGPCCFFNAADIALRNPNHQYTIKQEQFLIDETPTDELNISDIQTKLIQITGRFCEHHADDLLLTFAEIEAFAKNASFKGENRWIIGIGIRESGVDHNAFIMGRLRNTKHDFSNLVYPEHVYRKLLLLDITDKDASEKCHWPTRTFTLIDATHLLTKIE